VWDRNLIMSEVDGWSMVRAASGPEAVTLHAAKSPEKRVLPPR
jgi:hypothetical protein